MAGQLYLVNPSKRKRKSAKRRKGPSAAQLRNRARFAAAARARSRASRSAAPARRRRSAVVMANPAPRRRRARSASPVARRRSSRRVRRNPVSMRGISVNGIFKMAVSEATQAAIGGAGAIGVDMGMAQALKVLPDSMTSRVTLDGGVNFGYYAAKGALALGLMILGRMVAPPKIRPYIEQAGRGSLIVQAYEVERMMLPPEVTLGFYSPARIASARRVNGLSAYARSLPNGQPMSQGGAVPIRGGQRIAGMASQGSGLSIG